MRSLLDWLAPHRQQRRYGSDLERLAGARHLRRLVVLFPWPFLPGTKTGGAMTHLTTILRELAPHYDATLLLEPSAVAGPAGARVFERPDLGPGVWVVTFRLPRGWHALVRVLDGRVPPLTAMAPFLQSWWVAPLLRWFDGSFDLLTEYPYWRLALIGQGGRIRRMAATLYDDLRVSLALSWPEHPLQPLVTRLAIALEHRHLSRADQVFTVNHRESDAYTRRGVPNRCVTFGIQTLPIDPHELARARREHPEDFALFVGSDYAFNEEGLRWLALEVLPRLARRLKVVVVGAVGQRPGARAHEGAVHFAGELPGPHLAALYRCCRVVVVPLQQGTGTSLKTLEALAYGCHVVSTTVGSRGVDPVAAGALLRLADGPGAFAQALDQVLAAPAPTSPAPTPPWLRPDVAYRPYIEFFNG